MSAAPAAYWWLCHDGHESIVSEELMRAAIVEPRCQRPGCRARLAKRLRPYPELVEAGPEFRLPPAVPLSDEVAEELANREGR